MDPNRDLYTFNEKQVSEYVMEVLGLSVGQQTHLMCVRRLRKSDDKEMTVARAFLRLFLGLSLQRTSRFAMMTPIRLFMFVFLKRCLLVCIVLGKSELVLN